MSVHGLATLLAEHPHFRDLDPDHLELLEGCASNVVWKAGEMALREGDPADRFFLLRTGRLALEIKAPGQEPICVQTLGDGDVLGWSWIVPPYRWHQDARALELTRALGFDAACVRQKFAEDSRLGFAMLQRFVPLIVDRLHATRLQLLDVYGHAGAR